MKKIFTFLLSCTALGAMSQTPCSGGSAGPYDCNGFDLQSEISLNEMDASLGNDSWGWTDPQDGKEYALIALNNGTAFIDISNPTNPRYLGKLPTETDSSTWRDVKVYQNHAFIVSEAPGHGMQVFDLTRLRDVSSPPEEFDTDGFYGGFGNCHNIVINEDSGFAYAVGSDTFASGPHFIDISDPTAPQAAGGFSSSGYSHDAQVVIYNGPDTDYIGREILISSNANDVIILDVTNKSNPTLIAEFGYPNVGYTHQGWFTEDQRYFLLGDELDEINGIGNTRTIVFDFSDLDNPELDFEYDGPTGAIDHNGYVKDGKYYMANYTAGLRVIDVTDIANGNMNEVGFFDSHPESDNTEFEGAWSVYPYFASGNIVISDINRGFLLVRDPSLGANDTNKELFTMLPNPATTSITIQSSKTPLQKVEIFNILGQQVANYSFTGVMSNTFSIHSFNSGMYLVTINGSSTKRLIVK
ncbi:choice-of-anchor B family protein [Patiriisocius sp. Uisw_017]|jgi:choice-of-anchor B domain-containing protein|uniref:choice-of-anchor B family protein n=1 Tax=Patiriisocius sp. Uisw_017 TaxID=3230968 RepID=UPI0039E956E8